MADLPGSSGDSILARVFRRRTTRVGAVLLALLYGTAVLAPLLANDRPYLLEATNERAYERARKTLPIVVDELVTRYEIGDLPAPAEEQAVRGRLETLRVGLPASASARVDRFEGEFGMFVFVYDSADGETLVTPERLRDQVRWGVRGSRLWLDAIPLRLRGLLPLGHSWGFALLGRQGLRRLGVHRRRAGRP